MLLLAATLLVAGARCSSATKTDQFYNTDVGANWMPEAGDLVRDAGSQIDVAADGAGLDAGAADGPDASADTADGGSDAAVDAAVNGTD
jgi:hypothetical protein